MPTHPKDKLCAVGTSLVIGGSGLCGHRLVEMLANRDDVDHVVSFDLRDPEEKVASTKVVYQTGNLCNVDDLKAAFSKHPIQTVFLVAALVGPYHEYSLYEEVNHKGPIKVLNLCREHKVPRLVFVSSPSTRFDGSDINGLREEQLSKPKEYVQIYAETKARGEEAVLEASCADLMTVAVAPHQVYGRRDPLFLPSFLKTAQGGSLRVIGDGENVVSFCHVDNISHALILAAERLYPNSCIGGKFYVCTDGKPRNFWRAIDQAVVECGMPSLFDKFKAPYFVTMAAAYATSVVGFIVGQKFKLNPFAVRMMVINRHFDITNIKHDLDYEPLVPFEKGWADTIQHFKSIYGAKK